MNGYSSNFEAWKMEKKNNLGQKVGDSGTDVFAVNFAKFLRTPFLQNTY